MLITPLLLLLISFQITLSVKKTNIDISKYGLSREEVMRSPHYKDKVFHVEMSTDSGKELLEHWAVQGFSAVVAAIATRRLPLVEEYHRKAHQKCASGAETISEHAKCLLALESDAHRNLLRKRRKYFQKKKYGKRVKRVKREIVVKNRENYEIKTDNDLSPFGFIAKHLTNTLRIVKKKKSIAKWKSTIDRISQKANRIKKQQEIERFLQKRVEQYVEGSKKENMLDSEFAEIEKFVEDDNLKDLMRKKNKNMTETDKLMLMPMKLIRSAAKLGMAITGQNTTDFDRKIVRIFSPKIMSVNENEHKDNQIDIFSPSLLALHDSENEQNDVSMSKILGKISENEDSERFLDFIVEATGLEEAMQRVEQKMEMASSPETETGPEGQPVYFTKQNVTEKYPEEAKKMEIFENLDKTYTESQLKDMNRTGYTVMNRSQMDLVYGNQSAFANEKFLRRVKDMSRWQMDREIMGTIEQVSREKLKFEARRNDVVLSPIVLTNFILDPVGVSQPVILSPILLSSLIGSPAVYGVVILSPWVMVPVILSPRILAPVIVNPFLMVPVILSPLALNPFILCPGTLNPFILSPLLMSPFILSPQVMTPLILTPFCLTPLVLNPLALNPLILSPFVLSPIILSPQYVSAVILSPYALSPSFRSDGAVVTVFASPSWLS